MISKIIYFIIIIILVLLFSMAGCETRQTNSFSGYLPQMASNADSIINPSEIEWITKTGGMPGSKYKVLFAQKDVDAIKKVAGLVNAANKTGYNPKDDGSGKAIGYPKDIIIKMKNGDILTIAPLFRVAERKAENGLERTSVSYYDRVLLKYGRQL